MYKIYREKIKYIPYGTISLKRDACAFPEFTRAKRSVKNLRNPWDVEIQVYVHKSWKYRRKSRKSHGEDPRRIREVLKNYDSEIMRLELEIDL